MLTPYTRSQFVSRILTSPTGEQLRVLFLVTLANGELKAQVVSAEPLVVGSKLLVTSNQSPATNNHLYLPAFSIKKDSDTEYVPAHTPVISPCTELHFF